MKTYTYQSPLVKGGVMPLNIFSDNEEKVGTIQRYYKSIFHSAFDYLIGRANTIVRFKAHNANGDENIDGYKKFQFIRKPEYYIDILSGDYKGYTFHAKQTNFDIINAEFTITNNKDDLQLHTQKGVLDWVRFTENKVEVARWRSMATKKYKTYLEIENNATIHNPEFYALLGQMLYFVGD